MKYLILPFALLLLIYVTAASPDEAYGCVVNTVDGDTFDVCFKTTTAG